MFYETQGPQIFVDSKYLLHAVLIFVLCYSLVFFMREINQHGHVEQTVDYPPWCLNITHLHADL